MKLEKGKGWKWVKVAQHHLKDRAFIFLVIIFSFSSHAPLSQLSTLSCIPASDNRIVLVPFSFQILFIPISPHLSNKQNLWSGVSSLTLEFIARTGQAGEGTRKEKRRALLIRTGMEKDVGLAPASNITFTITFSTRLATPHQLKWSDMEARKRSWKLMEVLGNPFHVHKYTWFMTYAILTGNHARRDRTERVALIEPPASDRIQLRLQRKVCIGLLGQHDQLLSGKVKVEQSVREKKTHKQKKRQR